MYIQTSIYVYTYMDSSVRVQQQQHRGVEMAPSDGPRVIISRENDSKIKPAGKLCARQGIPHLPGDGEWNRLLNCL